ncbi:hypothetical protein F2Q69_00056047 [Brassica cretica]|uniref:DC1 domain-containing protein n=1 Tax=Brassica cretica TaxID=69181 RepID=A0A8S9N864_BRACR|nr:hypothetical protein F2Q69_00056047 [Brassica cretica]
MGLICDAKGDYEVALEHYVLASMAMSSQNHREDVASIDCSIGDAYMSLARFDESIFAYQKALAVFKQSKGESHSSVASVYVRLADLYNKIGKLRDSKSYCENALRIYLKPSPGTPMEEVATGFIEISAIYQSMNELDQALKLLRRALKIYVNAPGQQNTVAGIEAQMGVISYMMGNYPESYNIFKSAVSKFRNSGEKKTAMFGIALNQLGLACVQRYAINEAADLFEEAKGILENEYGPYHPDTLAVYSNLAGTYDAMGRLEDAIEILEYVVGTREEKLGTANPEVEDEKQRLAALLKEAGRGRSKRNRALLTLLDKNPEIEPNCGQRPEFSSGFSYIGCGIQLDVRCGSITEPFVHQGHPHPLFFTLPDPKTCRSCGIWQYKVLNCIECDFPLCFGCATLPYVVRNQKHDRHPITLCFGEKASTGQYWCDICETRLNPSKYFYTCEDCASTLHVHCVHLEGLLHVKPGNKFSYFGYGFEMVLGNRINRPRCESCYELCVGSFLLSTDYKDMFFRSGFGYAGFSDLDQTLEDFSEVF